MQYRTSDILDKERAERRFRALVERGAVIELTDTTRRSTRQNSYLYLILGYFAAEYGETVEYVKENYFKRLCNADLFVTRKGDRFIGEVEGVRSSRDLSKEEMVTAIDRFKQWSVKEAGIRLPDANEDEFLKAIEVELNRQQRYL